MVGMIHYGEEKLSANQRSIKRVIILSVIVRSLTLSYFILVSLRSDLM